MCGIVGIAAKQKNMLRDKTIGKTLTKLLKMLEYRGYDSVGIAVISNGDIIIRKARGKIDEVSNKLNFSEIDGLTGIGHTRWATHGPPSDENAHPHTDCKGIIAIVHNGIIKNFYVIKKGLQEKGHLFKSETDTEVIAHLIEEKIREADGKRFIDILGETLGEIEGSYAFAIIYKEEPVRIYFAKKLSPLIIGVGSGVNLVASDIPAVLSYTNHIIPLRDGEYGWISPSEIMIKRANGFIDYTTRIKTIDWNIENISKAGYPHFMLKEIYEQPLALRETFFGLQSDPSIERVIEHLVNSEKIYITGAGTSFHAGLVFKYFLSKLGGRASIPFISSEYTQISEEVGDKDILVAISQSGETIDTLTAVRSFRISGGKIISVSNVLESAIPRESDYAIYMRAGPEIGVAATKTYLTQVLSLTYIAVQYAHIVGRLTDSESSEYLSILSKASEIAESSIRISEPLVKMYAKDLANSRSMYILGRGLGAILALEAALKVKEIDYIHAEAYPAGESKHGPIALVEPGFPILFVFTINHWKELIGNIKEMHARKGVIYVSTPTADIIRTNMPEARILNIPSYENEILEPYAHTPAYQLLSYYISVEKGYDPDKPRNLAKTVTVE
ncbi:MAG: glutamine--fructose-6-phosphate transaminase (isomerizing) [Desulfurococcales archaeon]|nr:glutamine--fructose-6-phosphate transaminase (isomerizing) [Desulfurococcales archaeon]